MDSSEREDTGNDTLENRLWDAADQLRANSGLTSAQYSQPVLGLIFLRFAEVRFLSQRTVLEQRVDRDRRTKVLTGIPEPQGATRLAQQLIQIARGSARLGERTVVIEADVDVARRVATDCIPPLRWRVLTGGVDAIPASTRSYTREDLRLLDRLRNDTLQPRARRLTDLFDLHALSPRTSTENGEGLRGFAGRGNNA